MDWSWIDAASVPGKRDTTVAASENHKCLVDFVDACVRVGGFYTAPVAVGDNNYCFEVLRVNRKEDSKVVTMTRAKGKVPGITLSVQRYGTWVKNGERFVVYPFGDPSKLSPVEITSLGMMVHGLSSWTGVVSDTTGCIDLSDECLMKNSFTLTNNKVPVVVLALELHRLGWMRVERNVEHLPDDPIKEYSVVSVSSRRLYLQCVMELPRLWGLGLTSLPSNQPQSFYRVLLKGAPVLKGLGDRHYLALLDEMPEVPTEGVLAVEDDAMSDGSVVLDCLADVSHAFLDGFGEVAAPVVPGEVLPAVLMGAESDSDVVDVGEVLVGIPDLPPVIDGVSIYFDNSNAMYSRYQVKCVWHDNCTKYRNCGVDQCKHFGPWEPIAFLMLWNSRGRDLDAADHLYCPPPTLLEVKEWLVANGKF
jgi:hypothetical protein